MDRRLEELEVRMAFLEKGLTDLDHVVHELGTGLDDLKSEVVGLRTTLTEAVGGTSKADPVEDKPPHY
jgi:uncharacterized coiled-coil protein SlyX